MKNYAVVVSVPIINDDRGKVREITREMYEMK